MSTIAHRRFPDISARTPLLVDLKPAGKFVATDMHRAGGVRLLLAGLLRRGYPRDGNYRHRADVRPPKRGRQVEAPGQAVIVPLDKPHQRKPEDW